MASEENDHGVTTERQAQDAEPKPHRHVSHRELTQWFAHHPATGRAVTLHEQVRGGCLDLALWLNDVLPEGPNKTLALRHLEDVMHRANKAVALDPSVH